MDTSGLNRFDWPDYLVLPHTEAIKPEGWHLLAIFTATIVGFILRLGRRVLWHSLVLLLLWQRALLRWCKL